MHTYFIGLGFGPSQTFFCTNFYYARIVINITDCSQQLKTQVQGRSLVVPLLTVHMITLTSAEHYGKSQVQFSTKVFDTGDYD